MRELTGNIITHSEEAAVPTRAAVTAKAALPGNVAPAYPIRQDREHSTTRRGFMKAAAASSVCCTLGAAVVPENTDTGSKPREEFFACEASALPPGGSMTVTDPATHTPCLLIRRADGEWVAFDQRCTHLLCPVHYSPAADEIVCPCHHGIFNADGTPKAGPPRRALVRYEVIERDGEIRLLRADGRG